ncbi:hypothetical protein N7G274_009050 [Stereocaulon virgatum]|uniref:Uncharacterized protein n=1 Tax=Stereocaulon virgatum TaxID=373712 RepID=A0ABR3ZZA1_9LECA
MLDWLNGGFSNLRLDIVGFLAILGEASVKANAQVSSLSYLALLPRLLPAPQALIRSTRLENLKSDTGKVIGARSGGIRDYVNHIAHLLHSREPLEAYAVRCERITKPNRDATVSARTLGPLAAVELLGTSMSLTLLALSIHRNDGFALLTTILLSLLSTLIGVGSLWKLELMQRRANRRVPKDNIVIKYPHGAFLIVKCDENIARELYWHPEECNYVFGDTVYRLISLVGTLVLMFGVICLGNSTLFLQIGFAASYMILNVAYWVVAALPAQWHWDLSCYEVEREYYQGGEIQASYTQALWRAIAITQSVDWVRNGAIAPISEAWKLWVEKAGEIVESDKEKEELAGLGMHSNDSLEKREVKPLPQWDAEQALTDYLNPAATGLNV